jgi:hypothetical protein
MRRDMSKKMVVVDTFHRKNEAAHQYWPSDPSTPELEAYEAEKRRQQKFHTPVSTNTRATVVVKE